MSDAPTAAFEDGHGGRVGAERPGLLRVTGEPPLLRFRERLPHGTGTSERASLCSLRPLLRLGQRAEAFTAGFPDRHVRGLAPEFALVAPQELLRLGVLWPLPKPAP